MSASASMRCDECGDQMEAGSTVYRDGAHRPVCIACLAISGYPLSGITVLIGDAAAEAIADHEGEPS